jgi:hypothetical protein
MNQYNRYVSLLLFCIFSGQFVQAQSWQAIPPSGSRSSISMCVYGGKLQLLSDVGIGCGKHYTLQECDGVSWVTKNNDGTGVNVVATVNGAMYAAGYKFGSSPMMVNGIGRWNGSTWSALGTGLDSLYSSIYCLAEFNGELYVGGNFTSIGGVPAQNIAKWNGTLWQALGQGIGGVPSSSVSSLAVYNGKLYAGGQFKTAGGGSTGCIASWDGTSWTAVGGGITADTNAIHALLVYQHKLYAAGYFANAGNTSAFNIAGWNDTSWTSLSGGTGPYGIVYALAEFNGSLVAGGIIQSAGGLPLSKIGAWDGTSWSGLGTGIDSVGQVSSLVVYKSGLYVAGNFTRAGGIAVTNLAEWTSPEGIAERTDNPVLSLYPNPTNGVFSIRRQNPETCIVQIYNATGTRIFESKSEGASLDFDLSTMPKGIYLYRLYTAGKQAVSGKILIQ